MEQIKKISLNADITNEGIGQIKLGLNIFYFQEIIAILNNEKPNHKKWKIRFSQFYFEVGLIEFTLVYKNIIEITFNATVGRASIIKLSKGYKGKLWKQIKVMDKIGKVIALMGNTKYYFVNNRLFFEDHENIKFEIGEQWESEEILMDEMEEAMKNLLKRRIRSIEIHHKDLYTVPYIFPNGYKEIPDNWFSNPTRPSIKK